MPHRILTPNPRPGRRKLAADSLKRCPLCDSVNSHLNGECFVCRWHGAFDHDPVRVQEGLDALVALCPELADAIQEAPALKSPSKLRALLGRVFRRRIDLRA